MSTIYFDTETRSTVDLKRTGVYPYAPHPSTEITLASWAVDDGPAQVIDLTAGDSRAELEALLVDPENTIVIHNSMFDRNVVDACWGIFIDPARIIDTQVQAYAHGLPGGLARIGAILGLPEDKQKDARGRQLINMFSKPYRGEWRDRETHPQEWAEFVAYARQDIVAMREIHRRLPTWNYPDNEDERRLFWHDQRVNDHGVLVDVDFVERAKKLAASEKQRLADAVRAAGAPRPSRRAAFQEHLLEHYGVDLPDLRKDTLIRYIQDLDGDSAVKRLLELRLESEQTSVAKYKALSQATCEDGYVRGMLVFAGASRTARWSGRIFQPQNLPNPKEEPEEIEANIEALKAGHLDLVLRHKPMDFLSDAVRGCLIAPPGSKIVDADLSNIEGRVLAFLAGEEWKLQAFRDFDQGKGHDLYELAYARAFDVDPADVGRGTRRQIGKVMELFLGYQGGVGAYLTGAETYHIDLTEMAEGVEGTATPERLRDAKGMYRWAKEQGRTLDLPERVYVACEVLKKAWRDAHPATTTFWAQLELQIAKAIQNPGKVYPIGEHLKARRSGSWLRIRLPSGRQLCYLHPRVDGDGISYMGVNQMTRRWERQRSWGGKFAENCTQAAARDILARAFEPCWVEGYRIVLHVHDELVTYTADSPEFNPEGLAEIMTRPVPWAPGLPLSADGWEGRRFHKD